MSYSRDIQIEFNHCDPAGIVFFPRYFEMVNSVVENFFADVLRHPFARITMEEGCGVPTVRLQVTFTAPSRLGETVRFTLEVEGVGRSSADFRIIAARDGETRLECAQRIVWVGPDGRAQAWPAPLKARLTEQIRRTP